MYSRFMLNHVCLFHGFPSEHEPCVAFAFMTLTLFSDYTLRILMYAALRPGKTFSVDEVSQAYRLSRHHVAKVVNFLTQKELLRAQRGRGGGVFLAQNPSGIRIGDVVRQTESGTPLIECFDARTNTCPLISACKLQGVLHEAWNSFFAVLDQYTLADLVQRPDLLQNRLRPILEAPLEPPSTSTEEKSNPPDRRRRIPGTSSAATTAWIALLGGLVLSWEALLPMPAQGSEPYDRPPIAYSTTQPKDAISRLQEQLRREPDTFEGDARNVLRSLLQRLSIPESSQVLVFSKTSLQRRRISPGQPRAMYFSDDCYVGWVPGGLIEVAAMDPVLGPVFYSLDPEDAIRPSKPNRDVFVRDNDCLRCHGGAFVRGIPSVFARSVFPDKNGEMLLRHGSQVVDYRTPFDQRWGGWYVTGQHGDALHRGNITAEERGQDLLFPLEKGANRTDLGDFFPTHLYLNASSDLGALLVFEHQVAMHNALTRASHDARRMLAYQAGLQEAFGEPVTEEPVYESVVRVFDHAAQDVVDHLLFYGEALLPDGIQSSAEFRSDYERNGRLEVEGRSLRDLRFEARIYEYRCSPLIYSDSFLQLPSTLKSRIRAQLESALNPKAGSAPPERYGYLEPRERRTIWELLQGTHPDF